jgi:hypothetical protein
MRPPFPSASLRRAAGLLAALLSSQTPPATAQSGQPAPERVSGPAIRPPDTPADPPFLDDRGSGIPTSMFGTYIRRGELLVYPFFEHYRDRNFEYKPSELGVEGALDFRGRYRANESLIWVAYGLTDDLAIEWETAVISATFDKSPADPSALPGRIRQRGLGDVEGQLRWRWRRETARRPELFSYGEVVVPHARDQAFRGTEGWELKFGTGLVRGFRWGTVTARAAVEYAEASSSPFDIGEYAVEYLRRLSPSWRVYLGLEGTQDEVSAIAEVQWFLSPHVFVKMNNGVGLTSKATDWAPEVGVVFVIPTR